MLRAIRAIFFRFFFGAFWLGGVSKQWRLIYTAFGNRIATETPSHFEHGAMRLPPGRHCDKRRRMPQLPSIARPNGRYRNRSTRKQTQGHQPNLRKASPSVDSFLPPPPPNILLQHKKKYYRLATA
jgi:hypothetical protein